MSETDFYHPDVVEAFAAAWASIDGKLFLFNDDKTLRPNDPTYSGHYEGYMAEADELLRRAAKRLPAGMNLWELLSPPASPTPLDTPPCQELDQ